jgi:hypothetical protein
MLRSGEVEDSLQASWTFDERACEGHDGAAALALPRQLLEQPEATWRAEGGQAGASP